MASEPITVLLVDDHLLVRRGIGTVIGDSPDIRIVAEASSGAEAIDLARRHRPDVILMDIQLGDISGIEATRQIVLATPSARVVGLSTFPNRETIEAMFAAGACGYLLKDTSPEDLVEAIRRAHGGGTITPQAMAEPAPQASSDDDPAAIEARNGLGEQQRRVLALMSKGFTNSEIAERLGFSDGTARYHVSAILRKLDVSNRSEAVGLALRLGLVKRDDI